MTRHLLRIPGSASISFDVDVDIDAPGCNAHQEQGSICGHCGAAVDANGELAHETECSFARSLVAQANQDITTDGADGFVEALRIHLAREFANATIGIATGAGGDAIGPPDIQARRADLVAGYLAGYRKAEQGAHELIRGGLSRLALEMDAWAGVAATETADDW